MITAKILHRLSELPVSKEVMQELLGIFAEIERDQDERKASHRAAQAKYRMRKKNDDITVIKTNDHGVPDKENPRTPKEITLTQDTPSPPKGGSVPMIAEPISRKPKSDFPADAFDAHFWPMYPRKIGKGAARKVFDRIRAAGKVRWVDLIEGTRRFARDPPDPQFTPHAATWLNAERWTDEPANSTQASFFGSDGANGRRHREDPFIVAARREIDDMHRPGGWGIPDRNTDH